MLHRAVWCLNSQIWWLCRAADVILESIVQRLACCSFRSREAQQPGAGHSLGGALALLAAYDIKETFKFQRLSVHTFGAPRVGNHAFAR